MNFIEEGVYYIIYPAHGWLIRTGPYTVHTVSSRGAGNPTYISFKERGEWYKTGSQHIVPYIATVSETYKDLFSSYITEEILASLT